MRSRPYRSGALLLRVWLEPGSEPALRARIVAVDDASHAETTWATASSPDAVLAAVRQWLETWSAGVDGDAARDAPVTEAAHRRGVQDIAR